MRAQTRSALIRVSIGNMPKSASQFALVLSASPRFSDAHAYLPKGIIGSGSYRALLKPCSEGTRNPVGLDRHLCTWLRREPTRNSNHKTTDLKCSTLHATHGCSDVNFLTVELTSRPCVYIHIEALGCTSRTGADRTPLPTYSKGLNHDQ